MQNYLTIRNGERVKAKIKSAPFQLVDKGRDTSGINAGKAPRVLLPDGTHQRAIMDTPNMGSSAVQLLLILGLLATSCMAQAPGGAPSQPPTTTPPPPPAAAPVPAPTAPATPPPSSAPPTTTPTPAPTPPAPTPPPASSPPSATPPPDQSPGSSSDAPPGPTSPPTGSESPPPPSAAFSVSKAFVAGSALAGTFVAMVLA
ncbi:hypothetical protein VNO80_08855 [Phaseolus coccineus]|uniref:Uncharacterized protein n=1 Tax=Phaseolus coccineus TaxID=3886 RepID=A0AAN9N541_PHACN